MYIYSVLFYFRLYLHTTFLSEISEVHVIIYKFQLSSKCWMLSFRIISLHCFLCLIDWCGYCHSIDNTRNKRRENYFKSILWISSILNSPHTENSFEQQECNIKENRELLMISAVLSTKIKIDFVFPKFNGLVEKSKHFIQRNNYHHVIICD